MLGWCIVQTTVLPVSTVFLTVRITIAAARASSPEVGSSMKMIDGFATSSTAMVSLFLCSVDRPFTPGSPTKASLNGLSSTSSITSSTKICTHKGKQLSTKKYPLKVEMTTVFWNWPFFYLNQHPWEAGATLRKAVTHRLSPAASGYHFVHSILICVRRSPVSSGILKCWCLLQCIHLSFFPPTHPSK